MIFCIQIRGFKSQVNIITLTLSLNILTKSYQIVFSIYQLLDLFILKVIS